MKLFDYIRFFRVLRRGTRHNPVHMFDGADEWNVGIGQRNKITINISAGSFDRDITVIALSDEHAESLGNRLLDLVEAKSSAPTQGEAERRRKPGWAKLAR